MNVPNLSYTTFKYGKCNAATGERELITLSRLPIADDNLRVSFQEGYNTLEITYKPDISLIYYEVRITGIDEDYGVGIGTRWYYAGPNIAANSTNTFTLNVNSTYFPTPSGATRPDGEYRIGLYAKSSDADGVWDVQYLLMTSNGDIYAPAGSTGMLVYIDDPIPDK